MSKKIIKPVSIVLGTALITSLAATNLTAETQTNPFAMSELSSGYMLAYGDAAKKSGQEGNADSKSEIKMDMEGKCGEGKCGSKKEVKQDMEGKGDSKKAEQESK